MEEKMTTQHTIESLRRELAEAKLDAANLRTERVNILDELTVTIAHEARERQKETGMQEYRGNTVSYIYDKCANYAKQFQEKERELAEAREKVIEEFKVESEKIWEDLSGSYVGYDSSGAYDTGVYDFNERILSLKLQPNQTSNT